MSFLETNKIFTFNPLIIGFAGKKGCGKTTAASHLCRNLGFVKHSFADPIRIMTFNFIKSFGYSDIEAHRFINDDKTVTIPNIGRSARWIMQTLGTEWGRNLINGHCWVKAAAFKLKKTIDQRIVFDDVRFENEADLIRDLGGVIIHITRKSDDIDHHASERGIAANEKDLVLINDQDSEFEFCSYVESVILHRSKFFMHAAKS
jgi:hypothetical protein